jgi:hypothetical protein
MEPMELRVGEPPHAYAGSENSSGYVHEIEVEDESIIGYRRTLRGTPDPGLCGASSHFTFQFWPLKPGTSKVTVRFGRSWDPSTSELRAEYSFVVPEVDDDAVAAAVARAEAKLSKAQAAAAAKGLQPPEPGPSPRQVGDGAPGPKLLSLAAELDRWSPLLARAALQEQHAAALAVISASLALVLAEKAALEGQRDALLAAAAEAEAERARALEAATGEPQLRAQAAAEQCFLDDVAERRSGGSQEEAELFAEKEKVRAARGAVEGLRKCVAELQGVEFEPPPVKEVEVVVMQAVLLPAPAVELKRVEEVGMARAVLLSDLAVQTTTDAAVHMVDT